MQLRQWTPLIFLFPARYVETDPFWADFDFRAWARNEYEWTEDPWNGFRDFAQRPSETVDQGRGDCEDFALVATSWAMANGRPDVGLGFCWESSRPWPTHVIAYDSEAVYSSGTISQVTVDKWIENSKYRFVLRRQVD